MYLLKDHATIMIKMRRMAYLKYDVANCAETAIKLQQQINIVDQFCTDMEINLDKTEITVFRNGSPLRRYESWFFRGQQLNRWTLLWWLLRCGGGCGSVVVVVGISVAGEVIEFVAVLAVGSCGVLVVFEPVDVKGRLWLWWQLVFESEVAVLF
ncbi:hypothetical protein DPMN_169199 [Dreissena polymorpha]|uniref:Reverse transcriptase domain-containing protein n=1 Tax=Dreissena polymorpha TaxID=45954 RepID=A0A9D4F265_DREPO|nr:hypothetical protein DPMN_169199 [Dreissena polymorpha]